MREQLIRLIADAMDSADVTASAEIADYLLDNGVIVPPVKVGQTVYQIDDTRVYELKVNGVCDIIYDTDAIAFSQDIIGKRLFLTREAAEAALKAREYDV